MTNFESHKIGIRFTLRIVAFGDLAYVMLFFFLSSCTSAPSDLSNNRETVELDYVNWACNCPDLIETKYYKANPDYEARSEDCIYIEPANPDSVVPEEYYNTQHFDYYLVLHGQFYKDWGVPESYLPETSERPEPGRVFRYTEYELVKK